MPGEAWVPPLAAWIAGAALLVLAAVATGHDPLHASSWARWDSGYYEGIARHGYELHRCRPGEGLNARAKWCGNTAWFPGYPLAIAAVAAIGIPLLPAAVAVSWLAGALTLVLLWRWFLPRRIPPLACAAFAPGLVYLYAVFPLSLLTLAGVVFLRYLERAPWIAGLAGGVAALAYPLGVAVVPIVALVESWQRRRGGAPFRRAVILGGPAVVAGIGIVVAQRLQTGRWTAYYDVTNNYGGVHNPATTISDWVTVLVQSKNAFGYSLAPIWQFLLVTVLLAVAVAAALLRGGRRQVPLVAWCLGVWFVPLLQSQQSLWRSEAALVLATPLLALLPRRLVWVCAAGLLVVAFGVAHEFFAGSLI
jgi:hypothetical protein